MFELFNIWHLLAASVAAYIFGWLWYSPIMFGKLWMKLADKGESDNKPTLRLVSYGFFTTFAVVLGVETLLLMTNPDTFLSALAPVVLFVFAFGVTTKFTELLYESKEPEWSKGPQQLFLIGSGHLIFSATVMAAVLFFLG